LITVAAKSLKTAQTIHSLHYHAENSRKCERKQELVKSQGFFKLFAATVANYHSNNKSIDNRTVGANINFISPKNSSNKKQQKEIFLVT